MATQNSTRSKVQQLGVPLAVGVLAGLGTRYLIQRSRQQAEKYAGQPPQAVDWERARRVALRVSGWDQFPVTDRAAKEAQYREFVQQSEAAISAYLGVSLPKSVEEVIVVDRKEWLTANFETLKQTLEPVEDLYKALHERGQGSAWDAPLAGLQLGGVFGYLARRVLGQYEMGLLAPEPPEQGVLYFVEPNIERVQTKLGLSDEFRYWIALHEVTHVFEFEAHGWVRGHFSGLVREFMGAMTQELAEQGIGLGAFVQRLKSNASFERHWLSWVMTPEEHALFERLQALMSLVEGYSDHVMNELGRQLLPNFAEIERKVKASKQTRSPLDELLERLMGIDLKRAQYREGEAFVNEVIAARGLNFLNQVWEKPENLPSLAEVRSPQLWINRLDA